MATFFGEVLPVFSRAVAEDEDEEEEELDERGTDIQWMTSLQWTGVTESEMVDDKLPCSLLIIAVGHAATGFSQAYFLRGDPKPIGWLSSGLNEIDPNSERNAEIYRSKDNFVICQCVKDISPELSFSWVDKLFNSLQMETTDVILLSSAPASDFRTETPLSQLAVPFLRTLRTTKTCKQRPPCPYLEQPNLISGLSAQILTYCQVFGISAQLFVCYSESMHIDSTTIRAFLPVLKLAKINTIPQNSIHADQAIKKAVEMYSTPSTLYL